MNGAESLFRTAVSAGLEICFANPGTTEMPLVAAMDAVPGVRPVLGLFEGVCTGAADGYARMRGRPAMTLLHLGPGLGNGLANLHNAHRAHTPVVNVVGDHATWHAKADAPLASDIASLARPVSVFVRSTQSARGLAGDFAEAWGAARRPPGGVATLIVPADCQWDPADGPAAPPAPEPSAAADDAAVAEAAEALRPGASGVLLLGGSALGEAGLAAAARIAAATGCRVLHDTFVARLERGAGRPAFPRLPYFPEQAQEALAGATHVVLAGTRDPVAFFGYPKLPSRLAPEDARVVELAGPERDAQSALEALAERLGAAKPSPPSAAERPEPPKGELSVGSLGQALAALQPEGAVVVDEGLTSSAGYFGLSPGAPPHSWLMLTGGAIGQGLPCAVGAALGAPDRKVVAFQADGAGLYTLQSLWSLAREGLDVVVVVCANRSYRILRFEMGRAGVPEPGPSAAALCDLGHPVVDWVALARGFGLPAQRAETADELVRQLQRAFAEPGPALVEAVLP